MVLSDPYNSRKSQYFWMRLKANDSPHLGLQIIFFLIWKLFSNYHSFPVVCIQSLEKCLQTNLFLFLQLGKIQYSKNLMMQKCKGRFNVYVYIFFGIFRLKIRIFLEQRKTSIFGSFQMGIFRLSQLNFPIFSSITYSRLYATNFKENRESLSLIVFPHGSLKVRLTGKFRNL